MSEWDVSGQDFTGLADVDIVGYYGEWAVEYVLRRWNLKHWSHFNISKDPKLWKVWTGENPDALIFYEPLNILIEVKNNSGKYDINGKMAENEIIHRFLDKDKSHKSQWLLVVAIPRFDGKAQNILTRNNVDTLSFGVQIVDADTLELAMLDSGIALTNYLNKLSKKVEKA